MCVCSISRNDVPRVAQRYGAIAAHTRRRASVLYSYSFTSYLLLAFISSCLPVPTHSLDPVYSDFFSGVKDVSKTNCQRNTGMSVL